jgi:hypothetical protein
MDMQHVQYMQHEHAARSMGMQHGQAAGHTAGTCSMIIVRDWMGSLGKDLCNIYPMSFYGWVQFFLFLSINKVSLVECRDFATADTDDGGEPRPIRGRGWKPVYFQELMIIT